jgi:hypothetical protein
MPIVAFCGRLNRAPPHPLSTRKNPMLRQRLQVLALDDEMPEPKQ